jgi:membrane-associated phospholipid phosphatase
VPFRLKPVWPRSWLYDVVAVAVLVALTVALKAGHFLGVDLALRDWSRAHRPAALYWVARAGNLLGQGGFMTYLCAAIALYWVWRRHSIRPVFPVALAFLLTYVSISVFKAWSDRAAPRADLDKHPVLHPERFGSGGASYVSGHLTNSFIWYGTIALLVAPWLASKWRWWLRIVPPVVLSITTIYLEFHWFTDTVAGILLGSVLWRIAARVPWDAVPLGWLPGAWLRSWTGPAVEAYAKP